MRRGCKVIFAVGCAWPTVAVLLVTLGAYASPAVASIDLTAPLSAATTDADATEIPPGFREAPDLRTRDTKTFVKDDGTQVTRFYQGSVNYRDAGTDTWRPIDNAVVPTFVPGYSHRNGANRYVAEFPQDLQDPVRFSVEDDSATVTLEGAKGLASTDATTARYPQAMPGVSIEYRPMNDALKESLILDSLNAPESFRFSVDVSDGVTAEESKAGGIDFVKDGKVRFSLAAPSMQDSSGDPSAFSKDVEMTLEKMPGGYEVVIVPDRGWLASKQRVWPVIVDPSLFLRTDTECTIYGRGEAWETWRYCKDPNHSTVEAGANNSMSPQQARSLFRFDLTQIPADAKVLDAKFGLKLLYAQLPGQELQLHRVTSAWTKEVNWRTRNGIDSWTNPGGDFSSSSADQGMLLPTDSWVLWGDPLSFRALVQGWVDRSIANHGMLLRTTNESGTVGNYHYFWGSSSFWPNYWPYLDVKWKPQGRYTSIPSGSWVVDGGTGATPRVNALESVDNTLYVGGNFSSVGPRTGSFATFGTSDRTYQPNVAEVAGNVGPPSGGSVPVRAIAADGAGGWYIGGDFSHVGGREFKRLAHIRANGTLDEAWKPEVNGSVHALATSGGDLYVGGVFSTVGGLQRRGIAKLTASTGAVVSSWNAGMNTGAAIRAIAVNGLGQMYIGGTFSSLANGGFQVSNLAGLDPAGGSPLSLTVGADDTVNALAVSGSKLYAGGKFTHVGSSTRNRLARVDTGTNSVDENWIPNANDEVDSLQVAGTTRLYVGGKFSSISNNSLKGLAAIDIQSGSPLAWNPRLETGGRVRAMRLYNNTLYVGGEFARVGDFDRRNLAAIATNSDFAPPTAWNPDVGSSVYALGLCTGTPCHGSVDRFAAGGKFRSANVTERSNLAALNATTGVPIDWNPSPNGSVNALELARGALYVGGTYTSFQRGGLGGTSATREGLAYFLHKTGELAPWDPWDWQITNGDVTALAASATTLYVAAPRLKADGVDLQNLGAFSLDTGRLKSSFNPNPNGRVNAIETDGEYVFFGGEFSSPRLRAASYTESGALQPWNPQPDGEVSDLAIANGNVYVVGGFANIDAHWRPAIEAFPVANGGGSGMWWGLASLPWIWDNELNQPRIDAVDADANGVYIGGRFSVVNNVTRTNLAAIDPKTRNTLPLSPAIEGEHLGSGGVTGVGTVRAIDITDERLNVGGDWYGIGSGAHAGIASFPSYGYLAEPREGERTRKRLTLRAATQTPLFNKVRFEFRRVPVPPATAGDWADIPIDKVRDANNQTVASWPVGVSDGSSPTVVWDMPPTAGVDRTNGKYEVRAVFSEPNEEQYPTEPIVATLDQDAPAPDDAVEAVGPGRLDLLTGNFNVSVDDAKESGFNSDLTFNRSYNSRRPTAGGENGPLGKEWTTSLPVDEAFSDFARLEVEAFDFEEEHIEFATVITSDGGAFYFLYQDGQYKPEPGSEDLTLTRLGSGEWRIKDLENNETFFRLEGSGACEPNHEGCFVTYVPKEVRQPGSGDKTTIDYEVGPGNKLRIRRILAPGSVLTGETSSVCLGSPTPARCRWLEIEYHTQTSPYLSDTYWGDLAGRLCCVTFRASNFWNLLTRYHYDNQGRLRQVVDIPPEDEYQPLYTNYDYDSEGHLTSVKPPGQNAWTINYAAIPNDPNTGRLRSVSRPQPGWGPAQTTVLYDIPTTDQYAPYEMTAARVDDWGQQAVPTDVTAIFPPAHVPDAPASQPPQLSASEYRWASVHYMDRKGRETNVSAPGGGTQGHISTVESDKHNNVVRELTPQNRLDALGTADPPAAAAQLETRRQFSADGIELLHEWGPLHRIELADRSLVDARSHTAYTYDDFDELGYGIAPAHLLGTVTTGARLPTEQEDRDVRKTTFDYFEDGVEQGIKLRKPTTTIVDPESQPSDLNLVTQTRYNADGLETINVTPGATNGFEDPRTTKTIYYTAEPNNQYSECGEKVEWKNLPCKVIPGEQPSTSGPPGPPKLPETTLRYNSNYQVTEKTEVVKQGTDVKTRITTTTYDKAKRVLRQSITSPDSIGTMLPEVVNGYDWQTGLLTTTSTTEGPVENPITRTITRTYDALGRAKTYRDADDSLTTTNYDGVGRVSSVIGPKGNQSYDYYDGQAGLEESGRLYHLDDSSAGSFLASNYDANGHLREQQYPNGLKATTTYDSTGTATDLTYQKGSNVWLEFHVTESIHGQWMRHRSTLSDQDFQYDDAGRLTEVKDTPHPGGCTTRRYAYDADSNRQSLTRLDPGAGGVCTGSGGTTTNYSYDSANRLTGTGAQYDDFGRITQLPGTYVDSESNCLTTTHYRNDLVHTQRLAANCGQGGVMNTYELDPLQRQRKRVQTGTPSGTEVYHYGDDSDSPSWTDTSPGSNGSTWSRAIEGIGGDLVGIQSDDGTTQTMELQLTDLHGDVVATCSSDPGASSYTKTAGADEFGVPRENTPPKYNWLGGKQRRTELKSGVVQMGVRSYVPKLGRFLQVDPVPGGSANTYDYVNADPVNNYDLDGRDCNASIRIRAKKPRRGEKQTRRLLTRPTFQCSRNTRWKMTVELFRQDPLGGAVPYKVQQRWPPANSRSKYKSGKYYEGKGGSYSPIFRSNCLRDLKYFAVFQIKYNGTTQNIKSNELTC